MNQPGRLIGADFTYPPRGSSGKSMYCGLAIVFRRFALVSVPIMAAVREDVEVVPDKSGIVIGRANWCSHVVKHEPPPFSNNTRIKDLFTDLSFTLLSLSLSNR